jgi:DNA-binding transcriptional regulator PaaX
MPTLRIVGELTSAGYLVRDRTGRRTHYRLDLDRPMRHTVEQPGSVRRPVEAFVSPQEG